jgi:hypothetical protein
MPDADGLRVQGSGERWRIEGAWGSRDLQLCNDYLGYLADRCYSSASVRAYAFDLLHFAAGWPGRVSVLAPWTLMCCCGTWPGAGLSDGPASTAT